MKKQNVYPMQAFLQIEALMRKLGLQPADCLLILADALSDLDHQIEEHEREQEAALHLPFPTSLYGLPAAPARRNAGGT